MLSLLSVCAGSWIVQRNFNTPDCPAAEASSAPLVEHISYASNVCQNAEMVSCNSTAVVFWDYCYDGCNTTACFPKIVYKNGECVNWYDSNLNLKRSITWTCETAPFEGLSGWINTLSYSKDGCEADNLTMVQSLPPAVCIPVGCCYFFAHMCNSTVTTQKQCNCGANCGGMDGSSATGVCHNYTSDTWGSQCVE